MLLQLTFAPTNTVLTPADATGVVLLLFKVLFVVLMVVYLLVSILVVRQITVMQRTVFVPHTSWLKLVSLVHLVLAFLLFLYFVVVL